MLAVVQIGSRILMSECITARIVLVWARTGDATKAAAARAATIKRSFMGSALPARRGAGSGRDGIVGGDRHLRHVAIALGGEPEGVVAKHDRRILGRILHRPAGRQALDHRV